MNIVDSSGWLEYFASGPNTKFFAAAIEDANQLIVPTASLYEVFKIVHRESTEKDALEAAALMMQGQVVELDAMLALHAARVSMDHQLPMADAIILATAKTYGAVLWTQDKDFEGIDGVKYIAKI